VQTQTIELRPLRAVGAGMLGAALLWPALPAHPPFACPLRSMTGVPCPFCGMTRAVVAAVHGDIGASLRYNPGGILLVALAIALVVGWRARRAQVPKWTVPLLFVVLGLYNVAFHPTF
jgi:hypothetical protein